MWKNWNCCSLSRKCCVHVRLLATVGTAMQVAAFIGEIVCTALHCPLFLSWVSAPHQLHLLQCLSTWFLLLPPTLQTTFRRGFSHGPWTTGLWPACCCSTGQQGYLFLHACVCLTPSAGAVGGGNSSLKGVKTDLLQYSGGNVAKKQRRGENGRDLHRKHFDGYVITN